MVGEAGPRASASEMLDDGESADEGLSTWAARRLRGEVIKELREKNPQAQALVLSASLARAEIARAVESGAAGVSHKPAGTEEAVDAVRRLRTGNTESG